MVQYTFFGKVYPERCIVSVDEIRARIGAQGTEIQGDLRYYISLSQVTAVFICEERVSNIFTLKNDVEDAIRMALDALGYTLACGYDLEITQMIDSLGNAPIVFGVNMPAVERTALDAGVSFDMIMSLFTEQRGSYLRRCFADLREAIRVPKDTGFFCYRAIETLKSFFHREAGVADDRTAWELLRSELNVNRPDIEAIKQFADPVRHGGIVAIRDDQRAYIVSLTWRIVNKFILYAKAGYRKC